MWFVPTEVFSDGQPQCLSTNGNSYVWKCCCSLDDAQAEEITRPVLTCMRVFVWYEQWTVLYTKWSCEQTVKVLVSVLVNCTSSSLELNLISVHWRLPLMVSRAGVHAFEKNCFHFCVWKAVMFLRAYFSEKCLKYLLAVEICTDQFLLHCS